MKSSKKLLKNWTLQSEELGISLPVVSPSTVFESLLEADLIKDPFYGENEKEMARIYESDWSYTGEFVLGREELEADDLILRFHGLDTLAAVVLNGTLLGHCDNMHRSWEFSLLGNFGSAVKRGTNRLEIHFKSPTASARKETRKYGRNLREFPFFMKSPALKGVSYLRKALYSFGWDWGPQLPDTGIWRDVEIETVRVLRIRDVQSFQFHSYGDHPVDEYPAQPIEKTELRVCCETDFGAASGNKAEDVECRITLKGPAYEEERVLKDNEALFCIENPSLWWTRDLGEPVLYELTASCYRGETLLDRKTQMIGLRDVKLVRDKDRWGESFYFSLNGVPLFARGSNWIPVDSFIPRGKKMGLYEKRLQDAVDANMNMIRVWGGGIYEEDLFYDLCDRHGLLVWQDFMFACMPTPRHEGFLQSVRKEAEDNIRRLRHHPCIALWVGNNEIETAWSSLYYWLRYPGHKKGYLRLFEEMLPALVEELDPQRDYWPSSPSSGGNFNDPENEDIGDSHFWTVWHGGKPFSAYRKHYSRFMSEFGFESFPEMKSIAAFSEEKDWSFHSRIMENHQKNGAGNKKILNYMKKRFSIPRSFADQVTLSQITQAEAMEYGVDHWRRNRKDFRCMGALYWQINDCWPVASWSSVDYYGRWKALHYFARRFNEPVYCNAAEREGRMEIWAVNDLRKPSALTLNWLLCSEEGTPLKQGCKELTIPAADSQITESFDLENPEERKGILFYSLRDGDTPVHRGIELLQDPVDYDLPDPALSWETEEKGDSIILSISCTAPALYVHWSSDADARGSDNYLSLAPGETWRVEITPWNQEEKELFLRTLRIDSLYSIRSRS